MPNKPVGGKRRSTKGTHTHTHTHMERGREKRVNTRAGQSGERKGGAARTTSKQWKFG
tara:strand:- start:1030 stop:1203 length:174 start_codon:yes stop_codon:yes gene_type:complete